MRDKAHCPNRSEFGCRSGRRKMVAASESRQSPQVKRRPRVNSLPAAKIAETPRDLRTLIANRELHSANCQFQIGARKQGNGRHLTVFSASGRRANITSRLAIPTQELQHTGPL